MLWESTKLLNVKFIFAGTDYWLEVYCSSEGAWVCINMCGNNAHVKRPEMCEKQASKPITYVVTFDNGEWNKMGFGIQGKKIIISVSEIKLD